MSLGSTSPVEGSGPAVQHHRGRTALCEAAAAWGFSPGFGGCRRWGSPPLGHWGSGPRHTPAQEPRCLCALCALRALSPSPGQVVAHWSKNPTLNRLYTAHTSFRLLLLFFPMLGGSGTGRDWLVSPYMSHTGREGGVGGARIRDASCQRRIAFLLICVSADTMINEEHPACFNRSERENCSWWCSEKKKMHRKITPRHPKPFLQRVWYEKRFRYILLSRTI